MDVAVTGSSGLIGSRLVAHLADAGHTVHRLVRRAATDPAEIQWDPAAPLDPSLLEGVDAVVHLAGPGIADKRWTAERRRHLKAAREEGTRHLADAIAAADDGPTVLLSGSAIGFYGDRGDEVLTEASPPGDGYLAEICQSWEAAASPAATRARVALLRTGLVLDPSGGALAKTLPLFRAGLGGRLGSGRQWWSWISMDDEIRAITWLLENDIDGPVNLVAPGAVTNADFTAALGSVLGRPTRLPVPKFGPGLLLGRELASELLFASQHVEPAVLEANGFTFTAPEVNGALAALLAK